MCSHPGCHIRFKLIWAVLLHDAVEGNVALVPTVTSDSAGCAQVHTIPHWFMCMPARAQAGLGILRSEVDPWPAGRLARCSVLTAHYSFRGNPSAGRCSGTRHTKYFGPLKAP